MPCCEPCQVAVANVICWSAFPEPRIATAPLKAAHEGIANNADWAQAVDTLDISFRDFGH